ncbi:MAG: DMT family transporter [Pseudomonadota bacterium]
MSQSDAGRSRDPDIKIAAGNRRLGVVLVLISALVFSSAGLFVKGVEADSWVILFWRGLSAAAFTFVYVMWRGRYRSEFNQMGWPGLSAGIIGAAATIAFIPSFKHTSIANVSLIYAAAPFVCAIIAWLWYREKPARVVVLASLIAFCGVLTIVGGSLNSLNLKGDLLALWMTFGMATYLCIYRRYPNTPAAGPAVLLSLILVPIAWIAGDPLEASLPDILTTVVFGLVFSVASVTMAEGAKRLPASETALISALETPLAPIWAFIVFTEVPGLHSWVGGGVIMMAVLGSQWFAARPKPKEQKDLNI